VNQVPRVGVVIGRNRPKRICPEIAEWVRATAQADSGLSFELIDLAAVALPFLDEPGLAARGGRAAAQMQIVLEGLHMRNTATNPALNTNITQLNPGGTFIDIGNTLEPFVAAVRAMAAELEALIAEPPPPPDV